MQELVNLLLLGRAHSNVFDGQRVLAEGVDACRGNEGCRGKTGGDGEDEEGEEEGGGDRVVLTGVPKRGRVGFLTLFEAYKHVEVSSVGNVSPQVKASRFLAWVYRDILQEDEKNKKTTGSIEP